MLQKMTTEYMQIQFNRKADDRKLKTWESGCTLLKLHKEDSIGSL